MYKTAEDANSGALPVHGVSLKGCEVTPDVNISQNKFGIKLEVPSSDGMTEMCIRCESVSRQTRNLVFEVIKKPKKSIDAYRLYYILQ